MKMTWKKLVAVAAMALGCSASLAQTTDLIISEYIEGSSNNKAVEIYNGTGASVNLADYSFALYTNGAASPSQTLTLSGTLADGAVAVYSHASASAGILAVTPVANRNSTIINYNGDDAFALRKLGVIIDLIGEVGFRPTTPIAGWREGSNDTLNLTLVRKNTVCGPNAAGFTTGGGTYNGKLSGEWTSSAQDTITNLGSHTASCSVDTTAPTVTSIVPSGQGPTNADKASFFVTFSEAVVNFDAFADLVVNTTGTAAVSGATFSGSNNSYTVTLTGITGNGTLTLAVSTAAAGVEDLAGNDLASSVTSAAVTIANAAPASGQLLSETWTGATAGTLQNATFTLVADNAWDVTAPAAVGTVQISNNAGDKSIEHVVDGTSLEYTLVSPLLQTVNASTKSVKIEYETEYNTLGTNGSRQWVVQTYASAGSLDGYQIRFTGETDSGAILDIAVIDNGVVGSAVDVPPASGAQATGKRYKVTVVLTKVGADTEAIFQAENLTDGGFIVPPGVQTLTGESVDVGTTFDTAKVFARQRTRALLDDLNISFDVTAPTLTLDGDNPLNIPCGGPFTDPGAMATDDFDGDISVDVVVDSSALDVNTPGNYNVLYDVSDASGNAATQVIRQVVVGSCADTTPPVITLNGDNPAVVNCGATYTDAGASATDNVDNPVTLTAAIVVGGLGSINTAVPGDYTVTYDVEDAASNDALQVTRTVTVLNNCPVGLVGVSANEGDDVCLTVPNPGTAGDGDFTWAYSETLNGPQTPIPDATDAEYCLTNVPVSATGFYHATFDDGSKIAQEVTFNLVVSEVVTVPAAGIAGLAALAALLGATALKRRRK